MTGHNVLHTLGFDAFGLPAEQYAVQTGQHPRESPPRPTWPYMKRQLRRLGLGHDDRRSVATIDPGYYRWTQWIFLQIFNSWYDAERRARPAPIAELVAQFEPARVRRRTAARGRADRRPSSRRARRATGWRTSPRRRSTGAPALGTVLANEEVTADGRSERGNFPVFKRQPAPVDDAHHRLRRPAAGRPGPAGLAGARSRRMQRNWIGRSPGGARSTSRSSASDAPIEVFTTRPDTLFGATYMVLAPEHPLVDAIGPGGLARRHQPRVDRRRRHPRRGGRGVPAGGGAQERRGAADRGQGQDRCLHRRLRHQPGQRRNGSRSSSPTTC